MSLTESETYSCGRVLTAGLCAVAQSEDDAQPVPEVQAGAGQQGQQLRHQMVLSQS